MPNDTLTEALFPHAHAALTFAYRYNLEQYPPTVLATLMARKQGRIGSGKGLVGPIAAAQAGEIRAHVEALPRLERNAVTCRFAVGQEKIEAGQELVMPCLGQLPSGSNSRRMVDQFVVKHFRIPSQSKLEEFQPGKYRRVWFFEPVRMVAVADKLKMHHDTVGNRWRTVRKYLEAIETHANGLIDDSLRSAGIIGE